MLSYVLFQLWSPTTTSLHSLSQKGVSHSAESWRDSHICSSTSIYSRSTEPASEQRPSFLQWSLRFGAIAGKRLSTWLIALGLGFFFKKSVIKEVSFTFPTWSEIWLLSYVFDCSIHIDSSVHFETGRSTGWLGKKRHPSLQGIRIMYVLLVTQAEEKSLLFFAYLHCSTGNNNCLFTVQSGKRQF